MTLARPIAERFWEKVQPSPTTACWEWTAHVGKAGYGLFTISKAEGCRSVHRLSWELTFGPIPDGMFVLHRCDNRVCVRPAHLFLGTQADNIRDMVQKGRHDGFKRGGERSPMAKLSEAQARSIFADHAAGVSQRAIADSLGVSQSTVSLILRGERWPRLAEELGAWS